MSSPSPETRTLLTARAELRVQRDEGKATLVGYAAVFDAWSEDLGGFVERIRPGCFARALSDGADVRFVVNHDPSLILGRTKAGTCRLSEDSRGLRFEVDCPRTDMAEHYVSAVERGDIDGCSFRFYVRKEAWNFDANPCQRDLIEADLDDCCLATYPAYTDTTAAVRSRDEHRRGQPRPTPRRDRAARLLRLAEAD